MDNIERIDRYLNGNMAAEEKQAFESELASDTQLAEDLALQRDMTLFLKRREHRNALHAQLQGISKTHFPSEKPRAKTIALPRRRLLWVATLAAAAGLALFVLRPLLFGPTYEQYAQFSTLSLAEKSAGPQDWSKAETAFNSGNYAAAEPLLHQYTAEYPSDQQALLFLGICKMELNKHEEARQIFRNFADADPSLKDYADWYIALGYLKTGDKEACRAALNRIQARSPFNTQAKQLLRKLKNK